MGVIRRARLGLTGPLEGALTFAVRPRLACIVIGSFEAIGSGEWDAAPFELPEISLAGNDGRQSLVKV